MFAKRVLTKRLFLHSLRSECLGNEIFRLHLKRTIIKIKGFPLADKSVLADKLLFLADKMRFCANWGCERRWASEGGGGT